MIKGPRLRKAPSRSYVRMRPQQITERGPSIGRCNGHTVYEWIKIAGRPSVKFEFAGLAPSPLPATLFDPGKTILALVFDPGLAYEPAG
jgi:hypothetical protein